MNGCYVLHESKGSVLDGTSFLRFMYWDCINYILNGDDVLKVIYSTVEKNLVVWKEYKDECQIPLKNNKVKIRKLYETFETD